MRTALRKELRAQRLSRAHRASLLLKEYGPNERVSAELPALEAASLPHGDIHAGTSPSRSLDVLPSLDDAVEAPHGPITAPLLATTALPSTLLPVVTTAAMNGDIETVSTDSALEDTPALPHDQTPFLETEDRLYIAPDFGYVPSDAPYATGELQNWRESLELERVSRASPQIQSTPATTTHGNTQQFLKYEDDSDFEDQLFPSWSFRQVRHQCSDYVSSPSASRTRRKHVSRPLSLHPLSDGMYLSRYDSELDELIEMEENEMPVEELYATDEELEEAYLEALGAYEVRMR